MNLILSEKMTSFLSELEIPKNDFQKNELEKLQQMEFPTTKDEYWKYTRLGKISNSLFTTPTNLSKSLVITDYLVSDNYIVIENGIIHQELSNYTNEFGIQFLEPEKGTNDSELSENDIFNSINTTFYQKAIQINCAKNKTINQPLQLVFVGTGNKTISNIRLKLRAEKSSSSSIILTCISNNSTQSFVNLITEIAVEENAQFTLHKIQAENDTSLSISTIQATQAKNTHLKINTFTLSGLLVRNNINIAVQGENCETYMNGAMIANGKQHIDNHTFVDHQVANCYSNENYKYVLDNDATGVFNGRVVVRQDAQSINAYQKNGNILLSDRASINSKPELEIYADDVKCSHGSTTGQLDEDALFYLETRGIQKEKARKLLVYAFVGEVINSTNNESVLKLVKQLLNKLHNWHIE